MPTETTLNSLKVHKVPDFETWEENYNQTNGIGTSDVVIIPPEELKKGILPDQTDNSGKFLTTDGNGNTSWATVDALPSQSGNSGKYLKTNGSAASWENAPVTSVNSKTGAVSLSASDVNAVATSAVGANSGVAPLNASGKIDSTYLPSYVDDVIEGYYYNSKFYTTSAHTTEITGETGKIFVDLSTNKTYRYGGSSFTEISQGSIVSVSRDLTSGTKIGTLTINGTGTDLYAPTPETFTVTGGASTIVSDNLTANRALISNASGKVAVSDVTSTELGYLDGVTSAIQTQIDGKQAKITASGILKGDGSGGVSAATAGTDYQTPLTIDSTPTDGNTTHVVSSDGTYDKILARTKIYTASCSTAAGTAAKVATLDDSSGFSLTAGVTIAVRFTYGNSAMTPTLRVDGSTTGTAKTIAVPSSTTAFTTGNGTTYNTWGAYETIIFTYNGTYWINTGSALLEYLAYNKANSITASSLGALTSESDPFFSTSAAAEITSNDISTWNGKQDALPSQTNNSGKFLTTNGSALSWGTVDALPSQTNNSGKFLTTNGTNASWATVDALPSQTNNSGKFLTTNGISASWATVSIPSVDATPTDSSDNAVSSNGTYDMIMGRTKIYTASCSTAAGTAAKIATLDDSTGFSLAAGVTVLVRFTYGNSATTPTLNVNSTGAKNIAIPSSTTAFTTGNGTTYNTWGAYESILFTYNTSSQWVHVPSGYLGYLAYNTASGRQAKITASGILKGDGAGGVTAAVAGTDYAPAGNYKTIQTAVSDPTASGTSMSFIDTISQNTNGVITATKKSIDTDTVTGIGIDNTPTNGSVNLVYSGGVYTALSEKQNNLPSQSGNSGKFLTTNGSVLSWGDTLPTQTNNSGKFLTTNGTTTSWAIVSIPSASTTTPLMDGTASYGSGTTWARADHRHPTDTSRAPLASPTFTGTPEAPTANAGTNTTQVATTAFVQTALTNKITYGTEDLTAGTSPLNTGVIYLVYE